MTDLVSAIECMPGTITGRMQTRDPATSNVPKIGKYGKTYKRGTISVQIFNDSPGTFTRSVSYFLDGSVKVKNHLPFSYQVSVGFTKVKSVKRYPTEIAARRAADRFIDKFIQVAQSPENY